MRKNKLAAIMISAAIGISLLGGCEARKAAEVSSDNAPAASAQIEATQEPLASASNTESETSLPGDFPMEFAFSSGAGAWATELTLNKDGSFKGVYHDANVTDVFYCKFSGQFRQIKKVNNYTYSMRLTDLKYKHKIGKKWKKQGASYTASEAYGLEKGKTFYFYTPQTPRKKLSEEFLSWYHNNIYFKKVPKKLKCYGLYNKKMGYGFFTTPKK